MDYNHDDLYVAKSGATFDLDGQPVFVNAGDIARAGHPVLRGHMYLFEPLRVKYDLPKPPEPVLPSRAPANPVKSTQQGARSRTAG